MNDCGSASGTRKNSARAALAASSAKQCPSPAARCRPLQPLPPPARFSARRMNPRDMPLLRAPSCWGAFLRAGTAVALEESLLAASSAQLPASNFVASDLQEGANLSIPAV